MGGIIITQAAEQRSSKIKALVYIAAYLPRSGESGASLSSQDTQTIGLGYIVLSEDHKTVTAKEALKDYLYEDCSEEIKKDAASRLVPEANALVVTPVRTTEENFSRVRRFYITTSRDKIISPQLQQKMYTEVPCEKIITMDTGHSPFFSAPEELASNLISINTL